MNRVVIKDIFLTLFALVLFLGMFFVLAWKTLWITDTLETINASAHPTLLKITFSFALMFAVITISFAVDILRNRQARRRRKELYFASGTFFLGLVFAVSFGVLLKGGI